VLCHAVCSYNVLVVHAGLVPGVPLQQQDLTMLIKMRELLQAPDGRCVMRHLLQQQQQQQQQHATKHLHAMARL
jgi:hypothetical protein